ncbi:glycosyltransferase family 2 protein [Cohnella sp.]|uniref:glycosyltransferase family 2 protein n=1 Tax=Cohnella sp. TaxID=1883426 RepID=UPI003566C1E3
MNPDNHRQGLVSVVIPIYNGEKYISETIRSVMDQTYADLEVLCIIDGTKDQSLNLIKKLGDERFKIFEHENRGATYTRNRGLSLAAGEYIIFLDQDDVIKPEFIQAAIQEMIRTASTGVAVNGHVIDSKGQIIRRMYRVNKPKLTLGSLLKGNQMYTPSQVLLKRKSVSETGGFDIQADQADDWDMWIHQARSGKLVFLDRDLLRYRLHDANQHWDHDKMLRSELHIVERKLLGERNPQAIKSYSYLRYSERTADWSALAKALKLNALLIFQPRFYWTALHIAWTRRKSNAKQNGGTGLSQK